MKKNNHIYLSTLPYMFLCFGVMLTFSAAAAVDIREANLDKSIPNNPTQSCEPNLTASDWLATLPKGSDQSDSTQKFSDYRLKESQLISMQPEYNYCRIRHFAERSRQLSDGQGGWYTPGNGGTQNTSKEVSGTLGEAPTCMNHPSDQGKPLNERHSIMYTPQDGSPAVCFSPQDMEEIDTCDEVDSDGNLESFISREGGNSCMKKPDGSICSVQPGSVSEISTSDTTLYFYDTVPGGSNGACYAAPGGAGSEEDVLNSEMPTTGCKTVGGVDFCAEDSQDMCDGYGNCAPGCGSVTDGAGNTNFVCAASDFDGDGVPDYSDPDIDGDGIPNSQDTDNDNDGQDDPTPPNTPTVSMPFTRNDVTGITAMLNGIKNATSSTATGINGLQSSIDGLTSAIQGGAGTGTGGGAGGGTSAGEQGIQDGIDELKEELTEGEFTALGNRENTWSTLFDESFLEDMETQKENLSTQFNQEFNTIKSEFSSLVQITAVGGSFESRQMSLKGADVDVSLSRFSDMFSIIGLVMVFMATVYSMFIVIGGK